MLNRWRRGGESNPRVKVLQTYTVNSLSPCRDKCKHPYFV